MTGGRVGALKCYWPTGEEGTRRRQEAAVGFMVGLQLWPSHVSHAGSLASVTGAAGVTCGAQGQCPASWGDLLPCSQSPDED